MTDISTTVDFAQLLTHIGRERLARDKARRDGVDAPTEPHPLTVVAIVVGITLICASFWGLVTVTVIGVMMR